LLPRDDGDAQAIGGSQRRFAIQQQRLAGLDDDRPTAALVKNFLTDARNWPA